MAVELTYHCTCKYSEVITNILVHTACSNIPTAITKELYTLKTCTDVRREPDALKFCVSSDTGDLPWSSCVKHLTSQLGFAAPQRFVLISFQSHLVLGIRFQPFHFEKS